jgi:hypothetical protein
VLIAAISGVALLVTMFLPWYGVEVDIAGASVSDSWNAWQAFGVTDLLLCLVALVAIGVPAARAAPQPLLAAGALGVLLILFRLVEMPTPDVGLVGEDTIELDRRAGAFLGLAAAAGVAYGGWRANAERPRPGGAAAANAA